MQFLSKKTLFYAIFVTFVGFSGLSVPLSAEEPPLHEIERGVPTVDSGHTGNIFLEGEKITIAVPKALQGNVLQWRLLDDRLSKVKQGSVGTRSTIDAGTLPIGWYRVEFLGEDDRLLGFTTAAVLAKPVAPVPQDSPVCLDVAISWLGPHTETDRQKLDTSKSAKVTNLAALAGVNWIRDRIRWREMMFESEKLSEPNKYDTMAQIQLAQGMKVLQVFHTIPKWARDESAPSRADARTLYRFCRAMAKRFKGTVHAWEPWNEGNASNFGGLAIDELCSLQKAAYLGFKAGDPDVTVCWNPFGGTTTTHLADGVLGNETLPYYNVYCIHSYDWPHAFESLWHNARRAAAGRPIWVTEADRGMTADPDSRSGDYTHADAIKKAQLIPQEHVRSFFSGSSRHFHFVLTNYMEGNHRVQFGLLRHDFTPRPSYVALAAVGRWLAGAKCLGRYEVTDSSDTKPQSNTHIYAFQSRPDGKRQDVLVAWHEKEIGWPGRGKQAVDWSLPTEIQVEAVYDYLGRPLGKSVPAKLTSSPIYIVLPAGEASKLTLRTVPAAEYRNTPAPSPVVLQLTTPDTPLVPRKSKSNPWTQEQSRVFKPGQKTRCVLVVSNLSQKPVQGILKVDEVPDGWTFSQAKWNVALEAMGRTTITFEVTRGVDQTESEPWIMIRGDFGSAGKPVLAFEAAK